jgi:hypothetical protein
MQKEPCMHISRIKQRLLITLGIAGIVSLAAIGSIAARSAPPSIGRGLDFSEEPCFRLFFSQVRNICAEAHTYEMPLNIDNAGAKTVAVNVFSGTTNGVCCEAVATDEPVAFQFRSQRVCTNVAGTQTLTLTGAQVPSRGRMFVACTLQPGGVINTLNWNQ